LRSVLAAGVVSLLGAATLWTGTDGLRAFTTEQARRLDVSGRPRALPDPILEDQSGRPVQLSDFRGKPVLVDFIYTSCRSLCGVLSASFKQLAEQAGPDEDYLLLSLSFDPARDTPAVLDAYARRYGAQPNRWRFARVVDERALRELLDAFGIVVIPDRFGEFQHNAAIHLVDRNGRLAGIFDYDAVSAVRAALGKNHGQ
jgi:protein SCO1/2